MQVERLAIPQVLCLTPKRIGDERGYFCEVFRQDVVDHWLPGTQFIQDNQSLSAEKGTVRGLHFQCPPTAQAKLVRVLKGAILDVAVDIRLGSPTYGRHVACELSADNWRQLLVPAGFAHGFCTLEPGTVVAYKVSAPYSPADDRGLAWDDPALGIAWPVEPAAAILSAKDRAQPRLADLASPFRHET